MTTRSTSLDLAARVIVSCAGWDRQRYAPSPLGVEALHSGPAGRRCSRRRRDPASRRRQCHRGQPARPWLHGGGYSSAKLMLRLIGRVQGKTRRSANCSRRPGTHSAGSRGTTTGPADQARRGEQPRDPGPPSVRAPRRSRGAPDALRRGRPGSPSRTARPKLVTPRAFGDAWGVHPPAPTLILMNSKDHPAGFGVPVCHGRRPTWQSPLASSRHAVSFIGSAIVDLR